MKILAPVSLFVLFSLTGLLAFWMLGVKPQYILVGVPAGNVIGWFLGRMFWGK